MYVVLSLFLNYKVEAFFLDTARVTVEQERGLNDAARETAILAIQDCRWERNGDEIKNPIKIKDSTRVSFPIANYRN